MLEALRITPGSVNCAGQKIGGVYCTSKYLLLNYVGGLIVEDGPQAVGVSCSFWIQAEVQGHINGGEFIPEVFLILQSNKHIPDFLSDTNGTKRENLLIKDLGLHHNCKMTTATASANDLNHSTNNQSHKGFFISEEKGHTRRYILVRLHIRSPWRNVTLLWSSGCWESKNKALFTAPFCLCLWLSSCTSTWKSGTRNTHTNEHSWHDECSWVT